MKTGKTKRFALTAAVAVAAFAMLTGCSNSEAGTVSTDGSTSMEEVIGVLGEAFMEENKNITFTYNPTGSGSGIQAVQEGRCDSLYARA